MKNRLFAILCIPLFVGTAVSCGKESGPYGDAVYSESGTTYPTDLILYLSPYIEVEQERLYLVAENIRNLKVSVRDTEWAVEESYTVDTDAIADITVSQGYNVTPDKTVYPFLISLKVDTQGYTPAGEYAALIGNMLFIKPGSYICRIVSFEITDADGRSIRVDVPNVWRTLTVEENQASVSLGEFEIKVN